MDPQITVLWTTWPNEFMFVDLNILVMLRTYASPVVQNPSSHRTGILWHPIVRNGWRFCQCFELTFSGLVMADVMSHNEANCMRWLIVHAKYPWHPLLSYPISPSKLRTCVTSAHWPRCIPSFQNSYVIALALYTPHTLFHIKIIPNIITEKRMKKFNCILIIKMVSDRKLQSCVKTWSLPKLKFLNE